MPYSNRTERYNLEYLGVGNIIDPSSEERRAKIIESQLRGALDMHSDGHGVVQQGVLTGTFSSGNSNVSLSEVGGTPALECLINDIYVHADGPLSWTGLLDETFYYLHVALVEVLNVDGTYSESSRELSDLSTYASESSTPPTDGLLVATAHVTSSGIDIDPSPTERVTIQKLNTHAADQSNPHQVTATQAGALPTSGGTLAGHVAVASGITIDGMDISELRPLVNSGDATNLHTHTNLGPATREVYFSPVYNNSVRSENSDGSYSTSYDGIRAIATFTSNSGDQVETVTIRGIVPQEFVSWHSAPIRLTSKVDNLSGNNKVKVTMKDTANADVTLSGNDNIRNTSFAENIITITGGTWTPGEFFTLGIELTSTAGIGTSIADLILRYNVR